MTPNKPEQAGNGEKVDWEWEYLKLQGRITDVMAEIQELKQRDRVLSSRISRLQLAMKGVSEGEEEGEEPEEREEASPYAGLSLFTSTPEELQDALNRVVSRKR